MVLIGLLLAAIGVAVVTDVIVQNTTTIQVHSFGHVFSVQPGVLMLIGAGAGVLVVIGLAMLSGGAARRRRLGAERRTALRERDQLADEVQAERAARQRAEEAEAAANMAAAQATAQSTAQAAAMARPAEAPAGAPVVETTTAGTPVVQTEAVATPAVALPVVEAPAVDRPAEEAPVMVGGTTNGSPVMSSSDPELVGTPRRHGLFRRG